MKSTDNRRLLLETALTLFAARGYDAVGVQEIAAGAAVTKPTLYHYFGSKEGLLVSLLETEFSSWLAGLSSAARYQGDLVLSLNALADAWVAQAQARPAFFQLQLALMFLPASHATRPLIAPWLERQRRLLEALFEAAVPQHGNLRGHAPILALTLQGHLQLATRALLAGELVRQPDSLFKLIKQFMYGIYVL